MFVSERRIDEWERVSVVFRRVELVRRRRVEPVDNQVEQSAQRMKGAAFEGDVDIAQGQRESGRARRTTAAVGAHGWVGVITGLTMI